MDIAFVISAALLIASGVCAFLARTKDPTYYAIAAIAVTFVLGGAL